MAAKSRHHRPGGQFYLGARGQYYFGADTYIEARDAKGEMEMYQKGKIDRLTKEPVYLSELGKHKIQQDRFDWFAKYSFAIFITYEGKKIAIANGLDAPVAETAFQAICKQLDFS